VREGLVDEILTQVPAEKILWEAPNKAQQVFFIKLVGSDVNLGNIPANEVIPLETLRVGLRVQPGPTQVALGTQPRSKR
jgi:phosphosulfolactate synthase